MNNEGWGLTSMLLSLCILFFGLVLAAIIYNKNFSDDTTKNKEPKIEKIDSEKKYIIKSNYKNESDYKKLEEELVNGAKKYFDAKDIEINNYKIIIGLEQLKNEKYINDIIDPENKSKCSGYVIYDGKEVIPFIKCIGTYQTDNYNKNFE